MSLAQEITKTPIANGPEVPETSEVKGPEVNGDNGCEAPEVNEHGKVMPPPEAKQLGTFKLPDFDDPAELLEHRFLCRGGGLLLVGPTGVGKSAFVMHCAVLWALGEPAFGIRPSMPLRILIIQAENDDGDLAEMRHGVLSALKLSKDDCEIACERVSIATENARTSFAFIKQVVERLLAEHRPDLIIIDPALAYLGGDTNSQKDVGAFLRNQLNPLLTEYQCGCVVVHHTNKPLQGKERSQWKAGDFAYLGTGSAEWSNWARAMLGIRSIGSHDVYELLACKRGNRLCWKDEAGNRSYSKYIAHAKEDGLIYWREADESEIPAGKDGGESDEIVVLSLVPPTGAVPKESLLSKTGVRGVGKVKARKILTDLVAQKCLFEHKKPRKGNRPEIWISRSAEAPKFDEAVVTVVTTGKNEPVTTEKTAER
jgi:hypothetical protein